MCEVTFKKGLQQLNWNSANIQDYLSEVMAMVKEVDLILSTLKADVKRIKEILSSWETNIMFERKEGKTYTFEEL